MTEYWIQFIQNDNWEILKQRLEKLKLELYSFNKNENIKKGDTIFIYHIKKGTIKNGFISYNIINSEMCDCNEKVFNDKHLSKFAVEVKESFILQQNTKLKDIEELIQKYCGFKCLDTFKDKFLSKEMTFIKVSSEFGENLQKKLACLKKDKFTKEDIEDYYHSEPELEIENESASEFASESASKSDNESASESGSESGSESASESVSNEEFENGNIPIMFIPCYNFNKKNNFILELCNHIYCKKCDITNNNKFSFESIINDDNLKFKIKELNDEDEINNYVHYYQNEKKYLNNKNYVIFYKISCEDNDYNNCYLIII